MERALKTGLRDVQIDALEEELDGQEEKVEEGVSLRWTDACHW